MFGILQRYIARELAKTFVLAAVGLTLTFTLCGGVLNMIRAEVMSAIQLAQILGFVLPISLTLTLPISAIFACAIVYGRLAADNEFDACKASGINIHRLLAPALGLSLFTAVFTYTFTNHLIPSIVAQLDELVRRDIQKLVFSALNNHGHLKFQEYVLYAGDTQLDDEGAVKRIIVSPAAFLKLNDDKLSEDAKLAYCGTADRAEVDFQQDETTGTPAVKAALYGVRALDMSRYGFTESEEQPIQFPPFVQKIKSETKYMTLPDLLKYQKAPLDLPAIGDNLTKLDRQIRTARFYQYVYNELTGPNRMLKLEDTHRSYEIHAGGIRRIPETLKPTLTKVTVKEQEKGSGARRRNYKADILQITYEAQSATGAQDDTVMLGLRDHVSMVDAAAPKAAVTDRARWELDRVAPPDTSSACPVPKDLTTLLGDMSNPASLDQTLPSMNLGTRVDNERESARRSIVKSVLQITGLIHSRLAFSISTLVLLPLAAGLGIIYRGGQFLTAFVISFLPGMLTVVMNIMGRQLAENSGTHIVGLAIMWGGIVLLAFADVVVLARFLKR